MKKLFLGAMFMSVLSLLSAEKVFQHEEFSSGNVKNITVEATVGNVMIIPGSNSKVIVETYSKKSKVADAKINLSGDTLSVDTTGLSFNLRQPNVRIFLPKNFSFKNLKINISTGNVDIDSIDCDEMNFSMTTGNLDIDDSKATGDIKIKSTAGNVEIDDVVCANFKVDVTSGNIDAENITCETFDADSTSGRIACEDLICKKFIAETYSGNVIIELSEMASQKSSLKTNSGNIILTLPKNNDGYSATVNTYSGVFKDEFTEMKATNCKNTSSVYKNGGVEFDLSVKSGTVKIQKSNK